MALGSPLDPKRRSRFDSRGSARSTWAGFSPATTTAYRSASPDNQLAGCCHRRRTESRRPLAVARRSLRTPARRRSFTGDRAYLDRWSGYADDWAINQQYGMSPVTLAQIPDQWAGGDDMLINFLRYLNVVAAVPGGADALPAPTFARVLNRLPLRLSSCRAHVSPSQCERLDRIERLTLSARRRLVLRRIPMGPGPGS